ncbi:MAG: hypothetical protein KGH53_00975 [Candidatus Micrarchaeota archaeon]|nr:hypothetical protein [Candidatus Micrarchaeota archaeon]
MAKEKKQKRRAKEKKPKKGGKELLYIETETIEDLARFSSRFDSTAKEMLIYKVGGKHRIVGLAEQIEGKVIALYKDSEIDADTLRYVYVSEDHKESMEVASSIDQQRQSGSCYINLIDMDMSKFKVAKPEGVKGIACVRLNKLDDLVKSAIKRSVMRESIEMLYGFTHKGKTYLGAFDIIDELTDEKKTFYYSVANTKLKANFARYKFSTNTVDFSNDFGEHSYMYVKIINLAKPFAFFKE